MSAVLRRLAAGTGFLVYFLLVMGPAAFLTVAVSLLAGPVYWVATGRSWLDVVERWLTWLSGPVDWLLD